MLSYTNKEIFKKEKKPMPKKVKVLISVLVAALLLTVGGVTMVMAEGEEEETTPPAEESSKGLLERVADILEIDEEDLINAFKQAQQEMKEEAFIKALDRAVEEGYITQEQADEIIEWWGQKPEIMGPNMFRHTLRSHTLPRFHMRNGLGGLFCPESLE